MVQFEESLFEFLAFDFLEMWKILVTLDPRSFASLEKYVRFFFLAPKVIEKKKRSSRRTDRATYTYTMLLTDAYYELAAAYRTGWQTGRTERCRCLVVNPQRK